MKTENTKPTIGAKCFIITPQPWTSHLLITEAEVTSITPTGLINVKLDNLGGANSILPEEVRSVQFNKDLSLRSKEGFAHAKGVQLTFDLERVTKLKADREHSRQFNVVCLELIETIKQGRCGDGQYRGTPEQLAKLQEALALVKGVWA